jgi:hypothetical protein
MKKGYLVGPELLRHIREAVRYYINHGDKVPNKGGNLGPAKPRRVRVRLLQDLYAAVNCMNDPSYAQAVILERGPNGDLYEGSTIRITNRFENISVDAGTFAKAEWITDEWELYAADCPAESSSGGTV